jgi:hypothetical protein
MLRLVSFKIERTTNPTSQGENMKNLRKLGAVVVLTSVVSLSALAGEIPTPPCGPEPGQASTPPCSAAPSDMGTTSGASTAPGDMEMPPVASNDTSFTEIAADVLLNVLSLF